MATQQKKKTASSGSKRNAPKKKTTTKKPVTTPKKQAPRYTREAGGVVCLLLAFFVGIGYFTTEGLLIGYIRNLLSGLVGWGFWVTAPVFILATYILCFHRGRPIRLRLCCALLLPVIVAAFLHLFLGQGTYAWDWEMFCALWQDGLVMKSGGALSGWIAVALTAALTKVGAAGVFVILLVPMLLICFNRKAVDILDNFKAHRAARREAREEYLNSLSETETEPEPAPVVVTKAKKSKQVDIPLDEGSVTKKAPAPPVDTVRRKKLFDRHSRVPTPGEVLAGEREEPVTEKPEFEDVPELVPVTASVALAQNETMSVPVEEAEPVEIEIVPEPVSRKLKAEETAKAAAEVTQEIEQALAQDKPAYRYPPLSLLKRGSGSGAMQGQLELDSNQNRLNDALQSFGVEARIVNVTRGPSVTRYELELEQGVKLNKITNLSDDIALALGATAVRIAPIPDKISTVGIEVPNKQVAAVPIRDVLSSSQFSDSTSKVSFAVGKDIGGNPIVGNIAKLPHMLIAGTTGSGKSVCTNSLIVSLLYKAKPEEVRLIMVDPKMVELGVYNGIPHLLIPVVTDPKKAAGALQWAVNEMMKRYRMFSEVGAKDLASYNNHAAKRDDMEPLPQIVVVIDELADLMLVAAKEVEESICRVAQMGRASGMHLVIATQRPSADVITGLMKANIPSRIAFAVASSLESRIILDQTGAEKLVGKGDMLYAPLGDSKQRVQGCFISEEEVADVVAFIKENGSAHYDEAVLHEIERNAEEKEKNAKGTGGSAPGSDAGDYDELLPAAIDVVLEAGQASVSMLQRRLKLGYGRAARLVDQMEEKGVVGPFEGSKPRQLLITKEQWQEMQFRQNMAGGVSVSEGMTYSEPVPEEFPYEGDAFEQPHDRPPF